MKSFLDLETRLFAPVTVTPEYYFALMRLSSPIDSAEEHFNAAVDGMAEPTGWFLIRRSAIL